MRLVLEPKRLYRIIAIVMIIVGASMIGLVLAAELTPRKQFDCVFDPSPGIGDRCLPVVENEPNFIDYFPTYTNFIMLVSGISLTAFGGTILGMLLRLER